MRDCTKCSEEQRKVCDKLRDEVATLNPRVEGEEVEILCPAEKPPEMSEKVKSVLQSITAAFEEYAAKLESIKNDLKGLSEAEQEEIGRLLDEAGESRSIISQAALVLPGPLARALGFLNKPRASLILGEVIPGMLTVSAKSLSGHMEVDEFLIMNSINALTADRIPDGMDKTMKIVSYGLARVSEAYSEGLRQFKEFWEKLSEARKAMQEQQQWFTQTPDKGSPHGAN